MRRILGLTIGVMLLGLLALGPIAGAAKKPNVFNFTMSGAEVVPGPGDPDGSSNVNVTLFFSKP